MNDNKQPTGHYHQFETETFRALGPLAGIGYMGYCIVSQHYNATAQSRVTDANVALSKAQADPETWNRMVTGTWASQNNKDEPRPDGRTESK